MFLTLFKIFTVINSVILKVDGEGIEIPDGPPPPQLSDLGTSIDRAFHLALYFVIPVGIGMAIVGAIMWMMARDDTEKLKKAQMTVTWAIVGTVFLVFVGGLMNLIVNKVFKGASLTIEPEYSASSVYTSGLWDDVTDLFKREDYSSGLNWLDDCDKGSKDDDWCKQKMSQEGTKDTVDEHVCYYVASINLAKRLVSHRYYMTYYIACQQKFNKTYYVREFKKVFDNRDTDPGKYRSLLSLCHRLYKAGRFGITRDYNLNSIDDAKWAACQEVIPNEDYKN